MRATFLFLMCLSPTSTTLPVSTLVAQQPATGLTGNAMGVSMDRFMYEGSSVLAMSYRFSGLRPQKVGPEIGVSLFPQALPAGVLLLAPDLGAAYNLRLPGVSLLIKAGGSAITALATGGVLFVPGFHVGSTLLVKTGDRSGLRIDVIRHHYLPGGEGIEPIWSVGLGFAVLPRAGS